MKIEILASGSNGNCYLIKNKDTALLVECGIPFKEIQKKLNFKLHKIDACIVTHEHMDHAKACKDILKAGINLYMTKGTQEALGIQGHRVKIFDKYWNSNELYNPVRIGSFVIDAFRTIHDAKEPIGFKITDYSGLFFESLAFITDTMYCPYVFNVDYLMIEVNYILKTINDMNIDEHLRRRIKENHMSLETALDYIKKCDMSGIKKIYAMHLSDNNSDENIIKKELQRTTGVPIVIC